MTDDFEVVREVLPQLALVARHALDRIEERLAAAEANVTRLLEESKEDFIACEEQLAALSDQRDEARADVERLAEALAAYRSAVRSGEAESERLRQLGDEALAAHEGRKDADA